MNNINGTGRKSQALRELQRDSRQLTSGRVPNARVSVHPLGTTVEPSGGGAPARRSNQPANIPRYG